MFSEIEKKIIAAIQGDLPITEQPYREISRRIGIGEEELLEKLREFSENGLIRRFGATLRHQKSGFEANAMVAWKVDETQIDAVGEIMSAFREVTHCYRRNPIAQWPYNLYTMIHGTDPEACREIARRLAERTGAADYFLLFSLRELKKTSMAYFPDDDEI